MSKRKTPPAGLLPRKRRAPAELAEKQYPGSERFRDWRADEVLWIDPSERVVSDPDNMDPHPLANVGGFGTGREGDSSQDVITVREGGSPKSGRASLKCTLS